MKRPLAAVLAAFVAASPVVAVPTHQAIAGPDDGKLTVKVVRDVNGNGSFDQAVEVGVADASVLVTDPKGDTATGKTDATGTIAVDLGSVTGGQYRVQVSPPAGSVLQPAPAGGTLESNTMFVDVSSRQDKVVTTGLWNPADYCQSTPILLTACQRGALDQKGKDNSDSASRAIVSYPFDQRGTTPPALFEDQGSVGTVYGLAYRKQDKRVFSGAFAKRLAEYGPEGPGAVYVTDRSGATKLFTTVPDAGVTKHNMKKSFDGDFFKVPGKESLGDIDISEDGSELYVVNLHDKKLYVFDATGATGVLKKAYPTPAAACRADDWRPGALGVRDGVLYVGGVCSGQSSGDRADVKAVVYAFKAGKFSAPILTKPLDFDRGMAKETRKNSNKWYAWTDDWADSAQFDLKHEAMPQPLMTDIGIENNGDLVLNFRDRFGDQGGAKIPAPDGSGGQIETMSGGDLNRACKLANGGYAWEGAPGCANNHKGGNGGDQPAGVVEYYPGEFFGKNKNVFQHMETAQGALALVYGQERMPATVMDPLDERSGGTGWFKRADGSMQDIATYPNSYRIADLDTDQNGEGWGKANGLGDLEALCDLASVQFGNRVWFDTNGNGVQDGGEPPVAGVKVTATPCTSGAPVPPAKVTNARGEYHFGGADNAGAKDKLTPNTCYNVTFDYSNVAPATLPGSPVLADLGWTAENAGQDKLIDSNVDTAGKTSVNTDEPGTVKHGIDAGLTILNKLGGIVWDDTNENGVRDVGESGVQGVTVILKDGNGNPISRPKETTNAQGGYLFDKLVDGDYKVCFDRSTLPPQYAGYGFTTQDVRPNDDKDSDAATSDGCTATVTLKAGKREVRTVDAGLVAPKNKVGGIVWNDTDKNGIRKPGEQRVPDVKVTLHKEDGTPFRVPVKTGPKGEYEFPKLPDGTYKVCFDITNLPPSVAGYRVTKPNAGNDDSVDSDAEVAKGCTPATTLNAGKPEDLTLDMGLVAPVNRLGDRVWIDANRNGLQDDGEKPVPGVIVTLDNGAKTKTDTDGDYLFDDLPNGTYRVCFDIANLPDAVKDYKVTTKDAPGDDAKDSDAAADGCVAPTALAGQREDLNLDMGLVSPPNQLGNRVWVDTNNNGIQDDGEPGVPNMPVKLSTGPTTTTDRTGNYLFPDLPDGKYWVCFGPMPAPYGDYQFAKQHRGEDTKDSDADASGCVPEVEFGVGKRDNPTVDAGIRMPVNRLGDRVWIDANGNGLQDDGVQPVAGVTVKLSTGATTKTDAWGNYLFDDLPDGTYTVCFDIKALPAPVADYTVTMPDRGADGMDSDAGPATGCTLPTKLGVGKREDLTLDAGLVAPPNKIGDLVWNDKNRNGIQDPGEPAVPDVPVRLVDESGESVGDPVKTGRDGKYEFTDIPDGTYKVCFEMGALPGEYAGWVATKPNAGDGSPESAGMNSDVDPASGCTPPVTVGVGKRDNPTLDLGLVPPTNRVGDLVWYDDNSNGVQDPNEPGVPNLPVFLQGGNGKPVAQTKTDKDGHYLFTDLPDGDYKVCFNADPQTGLVAGRKLTKPNAGSGGPGDATDSDADPVSGCTHVVKLGEDKRVDLSLDAGLLPTSLLAATGALGWGLLGAGLVLLLGGALLLLVGRHRRGAA